MAGRKINYFYIGLFVLMGIALMVAALIFWGSKTMLKTDVYAETYFNESVQGLSEGSPVKYRGMQIGHVVEIAAVTSIYNVKEPIVKEDGKDYTLGGYIYVKLAMSPKFLRSSSEDEFKKILQKAVDHGLRTKLSIQGLTGAAYIDLDFQNSHATPPLPISWQPQYSYIPSTPSAITFFSDNATYLLEELRKINLQKTIDSLQKLINSTDQTAEQANNFLASSNKQLTETFSNLRAISQNVKQMSENVKEHPSSLLFSSPPPPLNLNKM
jgi:paraquat-inducible protein B